MSTKQCYFKKNNTYNSNTPFFVLPQFLFSDAYFSQLSLTSKVLYSLLLNRCHLSISNGWFDNDGHAYIIFTIEEIKTTLNCSNDRAIKSISELCNLNLIEKKRQGQGKPNILYVKYSLKNALPENNTAADELTETNSIPLTSAKCKDKTVSSCINQKADNHPLSDSIFQNPRIPENRTLGFRKIESNKTDNNKTDIISSFKKNQKISNELIDDIYSITNDICKYPTITIKGKQIESKIVREKIHKMDRIAISNILNEKIRPNVTRISNFSPYIVSVLYNEAVNADSCYKLNTRKSYDILEFEKNSYFDLPPDDW